MNAISRIPLGTPTSSSARGNSLFPQAWDRRLPAGKGQSIPPPGTPLSAAALNPPSTKQKPKIHRDTGILPVIRHQNTGKMPVPRKNLPSRNPQTHRGTGILPVVSCPTTNKPPVPRKNHHRLSRPAGIQPVGAHPPTGPRPGTAGCQPARGNPFPPGIAELYSALRHPCRLQLIPPNELPLTYDAKRPTRCCCA